MSTLIKTVSLSGVVEFIERPVVESLSAGINWEKLPVDESAKTHRELDAMKGTMTPFKKPEPVVRVVKKSGKKALSEFGSVNGIIFSDSKPKAKRKGYKQVGLQKQIKQIAGFAGWK